MKLVVAIVQDYDTDRLLRAVAAAGLRATRIASSGGFLRTGNTTVFMGVEDGGLAGCLALVGRACRRRVEPVADPSAGDPLLEWNACGVAEVTIGGAVVFVVPVRRFERMTSRRERPEDA